jgi:hypothetical protein
MTVAFPLVTELVIHWSCEMNATFVHNIAKATSAKTNPLHRPGKRLRAETEVMLRDMAYVLQLTRRVREQMLQEKSAAALV